MKEFVFQRGSKVWPEGETLMHVYAIPDLSRDGDLAELVRGCREATEGYPLRFVEDAWLHVTIAQLPDTPARNYSNEERALLARELQDALREVDPFEILVGSCLTYHSGLVFDLHPDDQLSRLHDVVESVIEGVRGPEATAYDTGVLHLTLAYATGDSDSDELQRKLRRVRPSHASMTIDRVCLVDVSSDADAKTITWTDPVAEILLGRQAAG